MLPGQRRGVGKQRVRHCSALAAHVCDVGDVEGVTLVVANDCGKRIAKVLSGRSALAREVGKRPTNRAPADCEWRDAGDGSDAAGGSRGGFSRAR